MAIQTYPNCVCCGDDPLSPCLNAIGCQSLRSKQVTLRLANFQDYFPLDNPASVTPFALLNGEYFPFDFSVPPGESNLAPVQKTDSLGRDWLISATWSCAGLVETQFFGNPDEECRLALAPSLMFSGYDGFGFVLIAFLHQQGTNVTYAFYGAIPTPPPVFQSNGNQCDPLFLAINRILLKGSQEFFGGSFEVHQCLRHQLSSEIVWYSTGTAELEE